jgi:hypothetical protein
LSQKLQRIRAQGARYARSFHWLIRESVVVAPDQWRRIWLATFVFLGSNAAIVGILYLYVRLVEANAPIRFLGAELVPRQSFTLLTLTILGVALATLVNAVSDYIARAAALRLHRRFQENSVRRSLRLLRVLPDAHAPEAAALVEGSGKRRVLSDYPRHCGWTLRFIGNAVPSLVMFVAAYGSLLVLDVRTTLVVTVMSLVVVAGQYPANLLAATASATADALRPDYQRELQCLVESADTSARFRPGDSLDRAADELFDRPRVTRYMDADEDRYRAMELSSLSMRGGGGLVLAAMLLAIGWGLLQHGGDWAALVVYATILRQLLGAATQVFRALTTFSRLSPYIHAYNAFVVSANRALNPPDAGASVTGAPPRFVVEARDEGRESSIFMPPPGSIVSLYAAMGLRRDLGLILQRALLAGANRSGTVAPDLRLIPDQQASPPGDQTGDDPVGIANELKAVPQILMISRDAIQQLTPEQQADLAVRAGMHWIVLVSKWAREGDRAGALVLVCDGSDEIHALTPDGATLDRDHAASVNARIARRRTDSSGSDSSEDDTE